MDSLAVAMILEGVIQDKDLQGKTIGKMQSVNLAALQVRRT